MAECRAVFFWAMLNTAVGNQQYAAEVVINASQAKDETFADDASMPWPATSCVMPIPEQVWSRPSTLLRRTPASAPASLIRKLFVIGVC